VEPARFWLSQRQYTRDTLSDPDNRYAGFDILPFDKEHGFSVVERLRAIAKTYDASVAQLRWRGCWQNRT
jgi:hypothetical protein